MIVQDFFRGRGSIHRLGGIVGGERVFIVSGRNSFVLSGARDAVFSMGLDHEWWNGFSPNPKKEQVDEAYDAFCSGVCGFLCAIGGGSAIDVAKAVKLRLFRERGVSVPLVACPTTAGSGSESTHFIVYYEGLEKQSEGDPSCTLPNFAILDPDLLGGLPRKAFASSVLDALSQSVESYWSVHSTEESRRMAAEAMACVRGFGVAAVVGRDRGAEERVMEAANLAGRCIDITRTTACHSFAYPMTSHFGVDHGHACALTLGRMLEYNSMVDEASLNDPRGVDFVRSVVSEISGHLGFKSVREASSWIGEFVRDLGLKTGLSALGVDRDVVVERGFNPARVVNNPRLVTKDDLESILAEL